MNGRSRYQRWYRAALVLALAGVGACSLEGDALTPKTVSGNRGFGGLGGFDFITDAITVPAGEEAWRCYLVTVPGTVGEEMWLGTLNAVDMKSNGMIHHVEVLQPDGSEVSGPSGAACDPSPTRYSRRLVALSARMKGAGIASVERSQCVFTPATAYQLHGGDTFTMMAHYVNTDTIDHEAAVAIAFNLVERPLYAIKTLVAYGVAEAPAPAAPARTIDVRYPPLPNDITVVAGWATALTTAPLATEVQVDALDPRGNSTTLIDRHLDTVDEVTTCGLTMQVAAGSALDLSCAFAADGASCDPSIATCRSECAARIFYVNNNELLR